MTDEQMVKLLAKEHAKVHRYPARQALIERGLDVDIPLPICLAAMRIVFDAGREQEAAMWELAAQSQQLKLK